MQLSTGITWQFAVTLFPELSMAVQRVQTKAAMARLGVSNNTTLKSMAAELVSKNIFFFMLKFLPFCPDEWAVVDDFFHPRRFLRKVQTTVMGDCPSQRTNAGINRPHLAGCSYAVTLAVQACTSRAIAAERLSRSNQQCGAQDHGANADEQEHLFLHVKILSFCPFKNGLGSMIFQV